MLGVLQRESEAVKFRSLFSICISCKRIDHSWIRRFASYWRHVLRLPAFLLNDSLHVRLYLTEVTLNDITNAFLCLCAGNRLDKGCPFLVRESPYPTACFCLDAIVRLHDHAFAYLIHEILYQLIIRVIINRLLYLVLSEVGKTRKLTPSLSLLLELLQVTDDLSTEELLLRSSR